MSYRRVEPSFARAVATALGDARTVLDLGVGPVSYAPTDREVTTADPTAGHLPFPDVSFDAALTTFTLPDLPDLDRGLAELRRVARGPVVVLTRDPGRLRDSWLAEYAPEVVAAEARRHPSVDRVAEALGGAPIGGAVETTRVPIPFTCVDGFSEAYYARPERLLDPAVRQADPAWGLVDEMTARRSVSALREALESGEWDRRHGSLRVRPSYDGSLVLLRATRPA
ncbi:SAM-dependent methyltransferase [Curtobacterium luteum]|uniref:SAM-dependent methyltransferase n=1 Tax=Curtobacterium luteum TaxID=33881 RepID=A0A8H9GBS7_9MICO|nr:methyltransferase domain-containing protein [Curtobacterium luteum]MBM7803213.1 SAM-dependent methyltransferase [Curtobacterium luteum]NUU50861.1 methyltransferase domain-containing protein [Curtobacterium luteum]GGK94957.1 hypothetical protein GCM10009769_11210 [Curtobacterium luteum]